MKIDLLETNIKVLFIILHFVTMNKFCVSEIGSLFSPMQFPNWHLFESIPSFQWFPMIVAKLLENKSSNRKKGKWDIFKYVWMSAFACSFRARILDGTDAYWLPCVLIEMISIEFSLFFPSSGLFSLRAQVCFLFWWFHSKELADCYLFHLMTIRRTDVKAGIQMLCEYHNPLNL